MRIDETLRRAAGLFLELPNEPAKPAGKEWSVMDAPAPQTSTVEQVVRDEPGPNLDEIKPTANPAAPVIDADGNVVFSSIYALANLPNSPFTAEQVLELLATLPADLPIESKRATVKITVNAMAKATGVTTEA